MNLIVLHPHLLYPGGASKYMLEVSSRLVDKGISVIIVLTRYDQELVKSYKKLKFIEVGAFSTGEISFWLIFPLFILRLKRILDEIPDKVLFPQIFPPVWWAAIYKFFSSKTKIIWMCQEPSAFIHSPAVIQGLKQPGRIMAQFLNPLLRRVDKILVKKTDFIIANSRYGKNLIKKTYQRKADLVAYPAVDLQRFKPQKIKKNYLFTVSRLDKQKNIDFLIRAFSLLPLSLRREYQLVIGGEGKEKESLELLVAKLKLGREVKFLGRVRERDLSAWYAQAKIVLFGAWDEPFGIIPVEAMASGTAVVGFKKGGVVESVIDGETGILLGERDEKKFSEAMRGLLENEAKLKAISRQARIYVEKNFSWDKTTEKVYNFLRKEL